ncbi:MAG: sugar transferase [Muribaculaceae bacterium]|nr:sugar transferase [Muribaculaceae bacterium]
MAYKMAGYRGKRMFDVVGSSAILLMFLPLILISCVAVGVTTPGGAIFRQQRVGRLGQRFECLKLRTMYLGSGDDLTYSGDPRITPVGRFLRRFAIDELPQLVNVIKGEMSLVGPRPHILSQELIFENEFSNFQERRYLRPGMTGLAQVSGFRGPTDTVAKRAGRLDCDLRYLQTASFLLDLKILLKTGWVIALNR